MINCKSSYGCISYRIAGASNRSWSTRAVALDIFKAFDRVWHAGRLHKPKSSGLITSFLSNRQVQVVLDGKSSQGYPVNARVPRGRLLVLPFSYYTLMTFLMVLSVILLSILMILLFILCVIRHLICSNNLNSLLNLNLIYKTLWTGARSGLLILMLGKLNWFHLTNLITLVLLM